MSYPYLSDAIKDLTGYDVPLPVAMFGLFVALAVLAGAAVLRARLLQMQSIGAIGMGWRMQVHSGGTRRLTLAPSELVSDFAVLTMVVGVVGARIFHILEHTDSFMAAPWEMIFSRAGLSVFGGLIFGAIAGLVMLKRWHLPVLPFSDAIAPALMLGYAIGRIGCQISGDGDWGHIADMSLKPEWLPTSLWAQTYDNNVFGEVIAAPGVYPTPIYESAMAFLCFGLLWRLRHHKNQPGWLFSVYLVLAAIERLLIEQIRVNPAIDILGMAVTQAELVAVTLLAVGIIGAIRFFQRGGRYAGQSF